MDASAHDLATLDFSLLLPSDSEQFLQFPPNSPTSYPCPSVKTAAQAIPAYGLSSPTATWPIPQPTVGTAGGVSSPHLPFAPASPKSPLLAQPSDSELSTNDATRAHTQSTKSATSGSLTSYNSAGDLGAGYASPVLSNSHPSPGYGPTLVHRSKPKRGGCTSTMAERSAAHKRRGSTMTRFADEYSSGSDRESEPGRDTLPIDELFRREDSRRQRVESEQQRRNNLRGGFMRLKEALPVFYGR
ncbi:hypothetical protein FRC06_006520, partial [Ceratobasidium sp. 370]